MKKSKRRSVTDIERLDMTEGQTIEEKIKQIMNNGEPIGDGVEKIYDDRLSDRSDRDIRTDRMQRMQDRMEKSTDAFRERRIKGQELRNKEKNGNDANSTDATEAA